MYIAHYYYYYCLAIENLNDIFLKFFFMIEGMFMLGLGSDGKRCNHEIWWCLVIRGRNAFKQEMSEVHQDLDLRICDEYSFAGLKQRCFVGNHWVELLTALDG